jgi:hypothetical protein
VSKRTNQPRGSVLLELASERMNCADLGQGIVLVVSVDHSLCPLNAGHPHAILGRVLQSPTSRPVSLIPQDALNDLDLCAA